VDTEQPIDQVVAQVEAYLDVLLPASVQRAVCSV